MQLRHKFKLLSIFIRETLFSKLVSVARRTFFTKEGFELSLLTLLIISVPYSIRLVFNTPYNFILGTYSDFTSISIYLLDLLVIAYISYSVIVRRFSKLLLIPCFLVIFLLISGFVSRENNTISVYFGIRTILSIVFGIYISLSPVFYKYWRYYIFLIIGLGLSQVAIQLVQFYSQQSIGLQLIGESVLNLPEYGVAKFVAHGTTFIRGYGTFPHPNILAAFLVIVSLLNLYLFNNTQQFRIRIFLGFSYLILLIGVALTFSRAGIIALLAGTAIYYAVLLLSRPVWKVVRETIVVIGLSWLLVISMFLPLYGTRSNLNDSANAERNTYNMAGISMILENPFLGVGQQGSVLHMEQYADKQLAPWEVQPIHNYYLLWVAEWGIAGWGIIALLLAIISRESLNLFSPRGDRPYSTWKIPILGSLFLLFLVDHYFYTIFPMQILLWGIIGVIIYKYRPN